MRHLLFLFLWLSTFILQANEIRAYRFNDLYGTDIQYTTEACQDNNGFVWISGRSGIMRCTENDCHLYQLPFQTLGMSAIRITYTQSKLWAYAEDGQLFLYNAIRDRFDLVAQLHLLSKDPFFRVKKLLLDQSGRFWIGDSHSLYEYHKGIMKRAKPSIEVNEMIWYNKDHLLIGNSSGIWIKNIHNGAQKSLCNYKNITNFSVNKMLLDSKNQKLWIGTQSNGLICYDFKTKRTQYCEATRHSPYPILALTQNSDSTLLVGIDGQGIWELSGKSGKVLNVYNENVDNPYSIPSNSIYDLFCDRENRIWICTYAGAAYYEQKRHPVKQIAHIINQPNSLANNHINCILENRSGNLWFATNNGLCLWEKKKDKWRTFYNEKHNQAHVFLSLCEDGDGVLWAGSYSSGLLLIDQNSGTNLTSKINKLKGYNQLCKSIFCITKDSQGDIWMGGSDGNTSCFLSREKIFKSYDIKNIFSIVEWKKNQMLLMCVDGVHLLNKKTGSQETLLKRRALNDMLLINDQLCLASYGEGLIGYNLRERKVEYITKKEGLPSNYLNSILYKENHLWLGTENGLCCFRPTDRKVVTSSSIQGLPNLSFCQRARYSLQNGEIIFGTHSGGIQFDSKTFNQEKQKGHIFYDNLYIMGRSIVQDTIEYPLKTPLDKVQELSLPYNQNTISIKLLALGLPTSEAKISWKLEGFDSQWSQASLSQQISYTNLPTGQFRLKIRLYGTSPDRWLNEREILITIAPPFWQTGWFTIIILALTGATFYALFRIYINRIKKRHAEEKIHFFANIAHELRTSITLITLPIEELVKEEKLSTHGQSYLQMALKQVRQLSTVVTQLLDFQKADTEKEPLFLEMIDLVTLLKSRCAMFELQAKNKELSILFTSNKDKYTTGIDGTKIERIIDNLLSNALKYSLPGQQIEVDFQATESSWKVRITDYGIGINTTAQKKLFQEFYRSENAINSKTIGSGIGLLLTRKYILMHKGTINYQSEENKGSTFTVEIPFQKIANHNNRTKEITKEDKEISHGKHDTDIVIVEDNEELRLFLKTALQENYNVVTACDGIEAMECIERQVPDLIISDVLMPRMNGFELCQKLKSTYEYSHIPVLLLTALSDKTEQIHGLGLGADDYLTKPFDMALLQQRIKSITNNRRIIREKALKIIQEPNEEPIMVNKLNDQFVKKALSIVYANLSNSEFNKDSFASEMNVSTSLLYKKIKSFTDQAPSDFIKSIRLNHALELLKSHQYSVTEVGELCGFSSTAYFSTAFKKHFGKTPTEIG